MQRYIRSPHMVSSKRSVLLIIDLQDRLLNVMRQKETVISNTVKLIEVAKILDVPIIATQQNPRGLGPTNAEITEAWGNIEPVSKMEFSCFGSDQFREALHVLGRTQIITVGVESHVCVSQTVLDGQGQYNFYIASDAVSSRTEENRWMGLQCMRRAGAVIGSTEMFLYELLERAGTQEFRSAMKYLK